MKIKEIVYSCGHEGFVEVSDDPKMNSKLNFYQKKGSCPDCYAEIIKKRDSENKLGCAKVKMSEKTYREEFADCKFTKVGIEESGKLFVFVPYERAAVTSILRCLGVKKSSPDYEKMYENVKDNFLTKDTTGARKKLADDTTLSDKARANITKAFDIIDKYQSRTRT